MLTLASRMIGEDGDYAGVLRVSVFVKVDSPSATVVVTPSAEFAVESGSSFTWDWGDGSLVERGPGLPSPHSYDWRPSNPSGFVVTVTGRIVSIGNNLYRSDQWSPWTCSRILYVTNGHVEKIHISELGPCGTLDTLGYFGNGSYYDGPSINGGVAYGCSQFDLPDSVTGIGDYAFARSHISGFKIPPRLVSIGKRAFYMCKELSSDVILPDSHYALDGGDGDDGYDGVYNIGEECFRGCSRVGRVFLPRFLVSVGRCAFVEMPSLRKIEINPANYELRNPASAPDSALMTIDWDRQTPDGDFFNRYDVGLPGCQYGGLGEANVIGERCFSCVTDQIPVDVPPNVVDIEPYAFAGSGVTRVTLGRGYLSAGVSGEHYVGDGAFSECESLEKVTVYSCDSQVFGTSTFAGCPSLRSVFIDRHSDGESSGGTGSSNSLDHAFENCEALEYVNYGTDGATYDLTFSTPFAGCPNLRTFVLRVGFIESEDTVMNGFSLPQLFGDDIPDGLRLYVDPMYVDFFRAIPGVTDYIDPGNVLPVGSEPDDPVP